MPKFTNMKDLEQYVRKAIDSALNVEVAKTVIDSMVDSAREEVYESYEPRQYGRRESLLSEENYDVHEALAGRLFVEPHAEFHNDPESSNTGYGLAQLIEYGDGGGGHYYEYSRHDGRSYLYKRPRPFVESAAHDLASSKEHVVALMDGLTDQGIPVK